MCARGIKGIAKGLLKSHYRRAMWTEQHTSNTLVSRSLSSALDLEACLEHIERTYKDRSQRAYDMRHLVMFVC